MANPPVTHKEHYLVQDFKRVQAEYEKVCNDVSAHFLPMGRACTTLAELQEVIDRCPTDSVAKVFLWDLKRLRTLAMVPTLTP